MRSHPALYRHAAKTPLAMTIPICVHPCKSVAENTSLGCRQWLR
jgi:hypothetical protein